MPQQHSEMSRRLIVLGEMMIPEDKREEVEARYWPKVKKNEGCWEWQAGKNSQGYGVFSVLGKCYPAPRIAYVLAFGDIPNGLLVRHKCDNPSCVNPDHLELGTTKDNSQDMVKRLRGIHGTRNHNSKLTDEMVLKLRERYAKADISLKDLAVEAGISKCSLGKIVRGDTWAHVGGPRSSNHHVTRTDYRPRGDNHSRHKLTAEQVVEIRERYPRGGVSLSSLAKEYNVHFCTIQSVLKRRIWKWL